jgi:hypothetical protein
MSTDKFFRYGNQRHIQGALPLCFKAQTQLVCQGGGSQETTVMTITDLDCGVD